MNGGRTWEEFGRFRNNLSKRTIRKSRKSQVLKEFVRTRRKQAGNKIFTFALR
eukprot:CAMPEP_0184687764 /NCGR_PEP_ID=MMETSP0312-20130426/27512_1 /TAXON_ID=31354 /ORGANISM="Compsopogon coeruleus, Strain SAG 36.94" /LENGTH=52 /DNA_ID=CAMNT_0027144243 /DNA_START=191 /DNA_END=346 /DNA_ORIENTATION=+